MFLNAKILGLVLKVRNMLLDMTSLYIISPYKQHWSILLIPIWSAHPYISCKCTSVCLYMNISHSRRAWILQGIPLQFQFQCDRCNWPGWPSTNPGCYTVARVVKTVSFHVHLWVLSSSRWKWCIWSLKDTAQQDRWFKSLRQRKSNSKQRYWNSVHNNLTNTRLWFTLLLTIVPEFQFVQICFAYMD